MVSAPEFSSFSVQDLIAQGKLLLASSGKEFLKPTGILASPAEVKKARKEAMGRLGLEFLDDVADDMDLDKELAADLEVDSEEGMVEGMNTANANLDFPVDVSMDEPRLPQDLPATRSVTPVAPPSPTPDAASACALDLSALSARERNRLKRKRKPGNSAFVTAPPPQSDGAKYNTASSGHSNK